MNTLRFILLPCCLILLAMGQPQTSNTGKNLDGIYRSTPGSFRQNFFIQISSDSISIYGWENEMRADTVWFRAKVKHTLYQNGQYMMDVVHFDFSHQPTTLANLHHFTPDKSIAVDEISLHQSFFGKPEQGKFLLQATKHIYDSRADSFEFVKMD